MANLLKPRSASSRPSYEGFDLSHKFDFTSSCGQMIPVYYDLLLPEDKIDISCQMLSIIPQLVAPSPIILDENIDYYFVPLECLYSLFPALLSDTNEDVNSALFNKANFKDGIPLFQTRRFLDYVCMKYNKQALDSQQDYYRRGAYRLANSLRLYGWYPQAQVSPVPEPGDGVSVGLNCLTLLAYQAVWQYYFRDDKRIEFDPKAFNVDDFYPQAGTAIYDFDRMYKFFTQRYHPWKKDPFTILSPSPLGGRGSLNHFGSGTDNDFIGFVQQWLTDYGSNALEPEIVGSTGERPGNINNYTDVGFSNRTEQYAIQQSLQQHRIAQAIEKLSSIWNQSGKSYKDMMANLFGSKVHSDTSKPIYLGSDSNKIYINEVIANVETAETKVGEMTGYGKGTNADGIGDRPSVKFTAPCHGIVIGIYSAVPDAYYSDLGVDILNTYQKRNSFPWPQTDELGEQPLFAFELEKGSYSGDSQGHMYSIYGWLPRFHELKLKPNRAIMGFGNDSSLSYWIPKREENMSSVDWWNSSAFYVSPQYLDKILVNSYGSINDGDSIFDWDYFSSDPILHFFHFFSRKASKMSSYGVPSTYFG